MSDSRSSAAGADSAGVNSTISLDLSLSHDGYGMNGRQSTPPPPTPPPSNFAQGWIQIHMADFTMSLNGKYLNSPSLTAQFRQQSPVPDLSSNPIDLTLSLDSRPLSSRTPPPPPPPPSSLASELSDNPVVYLSLNGNDSKPLSPPPLQPSTPEGLSCQLSSPPPQQPPSPDHSINSNPVNDLSLPLNIPPPQQPPPDHSMINSNPVHDLSLPLNIPPPQQPPPDHSMINSNPVHDLSLPLNVNNVTSSDLSRRQSSSPPPMPENLAPANQLNNPVESKSQKPTRRKHTVRMLKEDSITPPYPWATNRRAHIHNLRYLLSKGIEKITGKVRCKKCNRQYDMEFDLKQKFAELASFVTMKKSLMHDRAPDNWTNPKLENCRICGGSNCVKQITTKKKSMNWLFLLLGQNLGFCKLSELKYFCKHTLNHRTGAKDRLLYLTYMNLCKQLDPDGPYDV